MLKNISKLLYNVIKLKILLNLEKINNNNTILVVYFFYNDIKVNNNPSCHKIIEFKIIFINSGRNQVKIRKMESNHLFLNVNSRVVFENFLKYSYKERFFLVKK